MGKQFLSHANFDRKKNSEKWQKKKLVVLLPDFEDLIQ
jgi:hypothetical protein